jgi:hypothetical protein
MGISMTTFTSQGGFLPIEILDKSMIFLIINTHVKALLLKIEKKSTK